MIPITKYGARFATDDPIAVELKMYSETDEFRARCRGALSRWEHMRAAIKILCSDDVFRFHRWVDDFGEAWCNHSAVTVWGAGGTTKSGILGMLSYVDLLAAPTETLTVMVTNPIAKHWDRCFSKLVMWRAAMPKRWQVGKMYRGANPGLLTVPADQGSRMGVLCVSIADGESAADIAKKVGAHARRTRLLLEEAQGLPEDALGIGTNLFIGSQSSKSVHIGNPTVWTGNALAAASRPMDGDTRAIDDKLPDRWLSGLTWDDEPGITLVFDGTKSPALDSPKEAERLKMMMGARDIEARRALPGGEKSMEWWSQVRGRITPSGTRTVVISELDIAESGAKGPRPWAQGAQKIRVGGVDLSMGGDGVEFTLGEIGPVQMGVVPGHGNSAPHGAVGPHVCQIMGKVLVPIDVNKPDRSMQIAKAIVKQNEVWQIPWENMAFDSTGQQGAIVDTIEREAGCIGKTIRVNSSDAVSERKIGPKGEIAKDRYRTRAAELILQVVALIRRQQLCRLPDDVAYQLSTRGLVQEEGKADVEPKREWKRANKGKSPDALDSVGVMMEGALQRRFLSLVTQWQPLGRESNLPEFMKPKAPAKPEAARRRRIRHMVRNF